MIATPRRWRYAAPLLAVGVLILSGCPGEEEPEPQDSPTPGESPTPPPQTTAPDKVDADDDGYLISVDCNDQNPDIHPGADERCDGADNDCDEVVDPEDSIDATAYYPDEDEDGYGDPDGMVSACVSPDGYIAQGEDCDDADYFANPGALEVCDGTDNDCDGVADGPDAGGATTYYADRDQDSYGDVDGQLKACEVPEGYTTNAQDCDDETAATHPGAEEVCDGADNDCSGVVDGSDAVDAPAWYLDRDGDHYGSAQTAVYTCTAPKGYIEDGTDCDDTTSSIHPGAAEVPYDEIDQDCDGSDLTDVDADGYALCAPAAPPESCDCDEQHADAYPGAPELDDGRDNDCDGQVDDGIAKPGDLIVTEVFANPAGEDMLGEWFELYNTSDFTIDLNGWYFLDNSSSTANAVMVSEHVVVVPGDFLVLGSCGDPALNGGVTVDYAYYACPPSGGGYFALANDPSASTPEYIEMYNKKDGTLIDRMSYSEKAREGLSRQLDPADFDAVLNDASTVGDVWCFKGATPGEMNVSCP